jgi:hypothetical protein
MLALLAATLALASCASAWNFTTPLDEYIALPDPTYTYFDTVCPLTNSPLSLIVSVF